MCVLSENMCAVCKWVCCLKMGVLSVNMCAVWKYVCCLKIIRNIPDSNHTLHWSTSQQIIRTNAQAQRCTFSHKLCNIPTLPATDTCTVPRSLYKHFYSCKVLISTSYAPTLHIHLLRTLRYAQFLRTNIFMHFCLYDVNSPRWSEEAWKRIV